MNEWSKTSSQRLSMAHKDIQTLANAVLELHDCTVVCTHRNEESQNHAFYMKKSKLKYPQSKHNKMPSLAIDLGPWERGHDIYDRERVLYFAGIVIGIADRLYKEGKMTFRVRWGGDWDMDNNFKEHSFFDGIHFELITS